MTTTAQELAAEFLSLATESDRHVFVQLLSAEQIRMLDRELCQYCESSLL